MVGADRAFGRARAQRRGGRVSRVGSLPVRDGASGPSGVGPGAARTKPRAGVTGGSAWWRRLLPQRPGPEGAADLIARVTAVAAELRSGAPPPVAWERGLGVRTVDGLPLLEELVGVTRDPRAAGAVLAAARLAEEVGAAPAAVLDRMATALAEEAEADARRRAAFSGPRSTARLLAWLPLVGVVLGLALGARPDQVLLDGRGGTVLLGLAALLMAVGRWWTARHLAAAAAAGEQDG